jgi:hypothetical protein
MAGNVVSFRHRFPVLFCAKSRIFREPLPNIAAPILCDPATFRASVAQPSLRPLSGAGPRAFLATD